MDLPPPLWLPPDPSSTQIARFTQHIAARYAIPLSTYADLHRWSIENIASFWEEVWHWVGITASIPFDQVLPREAPLFPRPDFFSAARLNFAENLLFPAGLDLANDAPALIAVTESTRATLSWQDLREQVRQCRAALSAHGVGPQDCVAGFVGNHAQTVIAMLAATSLGAIWTGVSPDTGVTAVLDRLVQIEPVVLFADNGVEYNGRFHESITKTRELVEQLPKLHAVVIFNTVKALPGPASSIKVAHGQAWTYTDFLLR